MILLAVSILLWCFVMLALIRFDSMLLWKLSILATEAGHWLALLGVFIFVYALLEDTLHFLPMALSLSASWILLRPVRLALSIARTLPRRMERAFGPFSTSQKAFSLTNLFIPVLSSRPPDRLSLKTDDGRDLPIEFYRPVTTGKTPLIVIIHGGGWNNGRPGQLSLLNHVLRRKGYAVASISYGLAPNIQWPMQRNDIVACLEYLRGNAADLQLDPEKIVLLGRSAGGQLAAHVAYTRDDLGIIGIISLYAPMDLAFAYENTHDDDLIHSRRLMMEYLGGPYDAIPNVYKDASPYFHVHTKTPPTLLIHGKHDLLTWYLQSWRLHRTLNNVRAVTMYLELQWATHAFDLFLNSPSGQLTQYSVLSFLDACVRDTASKR